MATRGPTAECTGLVTLPKVTSFNIGPQWTMAKKEARQICNGIKPDEVFSKFEKLFTYQTLHADVSYVNDTWLAAKALLLYQNYPGFFNFIKFWDFIVLWSSTHMIAHLLVPLYDNNSTKTKINQKYIKKNQTSSDFICCGNILYLSAKYHLLCLGNIKKKRLRESILNVSLNKFLKN